MNRFGKTSPGSATRMIVVSTFVGCLFYGLVLRAEPFHEAVLRAVVVSTAALVGGVVLDLRRRRRAERRD